ncbi:hypothetical protein TVAG_211980 [Trichomonas vaginalis G3]|uniref:Phosphoprotein phosphatase n=1 Tax=Trichomonas vaginalis (strain ATCC PRA-98 / G3) TaxID=412133 RepID=A2EIF4_TRIV3|nr:protein phosphatase regulator protein [Trichomonas vaginalis G3]EAY07559.1 hypothetical protein TVAG_211980 [Trichomonas vaginalis G3]KAI5541266.1 protein phosphatase regulator protein [Trichomonas vaginalis G3]|eukprot:XP_001319782.1 hypothetical protein [Trichomonas vaginalis G3]
MLRRQYSKKQTSLSLFKSNPPAVRRITGQFEIPPPQLPSNQEEENTNKIEENHLSLYDSPIADIKVPQTSLLKMDVFRNLAPVELVDIPTLPQIESSSFQGIFEKKIEACCQICPFADEELERVSIERKTTHLTKLYRLFLGAIPQSTKLTDKNYELLYGMVMRNIVRRLPTIDPLALENYDVSPFTEPSWPHLSIAYSILGKILAEFPNAPFFDFKTLSNILLVAGSADGRERQQIVIFISRFISLNQQFNDPLIQKFASIIENYLDSMHNPFIILTILTTFVAIIRDLGEIPPLFSRFFRHFIVRLLSDIHLPFYDQIMCTIIDLYIEDDSRNSICVVHQVLRHWPYTKLAKQSIFLYLIIKCFPKLPNKEIQPNLTRILNILATSTDSECYRVAEAAFQMWTTHGFDRIINENIKLINHIFAVHVFNARENHWSPTVRNNANFVLSILMKKDPKFGNNFNQESTIDDADCKKLRFWVYIAREASKVDQSFDLSKKLTEITNVCTPRQIQSRGSNAYIKRPVRQRANSCCVSQPSSAPSRIARPFGAH